ncbi:PAC2 family protein [Gordonia desulfuricans]|uniref:PAC2 family protein n=1 Tax=Gordonia desulfuricans TaxID=89051 RepID=A0A7K3LMG5_9ACTN|nr:MULTISPECIES: PAC2 family protein [Gordonia]EMP11611.2 proteasome protein [Gordonia sp. NB41Y]NDK89429.1 PAC2 family protein [Gordonia desulfuricans]WLP91089.1 PAC2 family protein [Gordonia sp. NB41Y]
MDEHPTGDSSLYELAFPAPHMSRGDSETGPVLVHALDGFADAGHAVALAAAHLRDTLESDLVATFDADELMDYRSRRPTISFSGETFTDITMPQLTLHAVRDAGDKVFLLLSGAEPDLRWERFGEAVRRLADHFGVSDVVGLNAIPMAVPHTRPATITAHGNDPESLGDLPRWGSAMKLPASASMLLELRLGEHGRRTTGLSVHVPHYLSQTDYPAASARLLTAVGDYTGLDLPVAALDVAAERVREQVDSEVSGNPEVESVVKALEQQYDAFQEAQTERASLLATEGSLPSGDELGAELEQFLAGLNGDDQTDGPDDTPGGRPFPI